MGLSTHLILLAIFFVFYVTANNVTWTPDTITYRETFLRADTIEWKYRLQINSTGPIYSESIGHFRLKFSLTYARNSKLFGVTECININAIDLKSVFRRVILGSYPLVIGDDTPLSQFFRINTVKYYDEYNSTIKATNTFDLDIFAVRNMSRFTVTYLTSNCTPPHTIGSWHDSSRWANGIAPDVNSTVIIPSNAGYIQLSEDVMVKGLHMYGGTILAMTTTCPAGWTLDDRSTLTLVLFLTLLLCKLLKS